MPESAPAVLSAVSSASAPAVHVLVFNLGKEEYAFALTDIREILTVPVLTPVPQSAPAVRGITNVRGKMVTVVDLATLLGLSSTSAEKKYVIIAEQGKELFGLLVDDVSGVLRTSAEHACKTPELLRTKAAAAFLSGALVMPIAQSDTEKTAKTDGADAQASRIILTLQLQAIVAALVPASSSAALPS